MTEQHVPGLDAAHPTRAEIKAEHDPSGDLLGQVSRDISVLMRQELELAKAELKETGTRAGKGVGMLGGAGVAQPAAAELPVGVLEPRGGPEVDVEALVVDVGEMRDRQQVLLHPQLGGRRGALALGAGALLGGRGACAPAGRVRARFAVSAAAGDDAAEAETDEDETDQGVGTRHDTSGDTAGARTQEGCTRVPWLGVQWARG